MIAVGRGEEAARLYQQSLDIARALAAAEPDRADYQRDLSVSLHRNAQLLARGGDQAAASEHLAEAIAIAERAVKRSPDDAEAVVDLAYLIMQAPTSDGGSSPPHPSATGMLLDLKAADRLPARGQQLLDELTPDDR